MYFTVLGSTWAAGKKDEKFAINYQLYSAMGLTVSSSLL